MISPSYTLHTQVWDFPYIATPIPQYFAQDFPSHSLLHSTYLSPTTPTRGMYLGHTIPFKG